MEFVRGLSQSKMLLGGRGWILEKQEQMELVWRVRSKFRKDKLALVIQEMNVELVAVLEMMSSGLLLVRKHVQLQQIYVHGQQVLLQQLRKLEIFVEEHFSVI